MGESDRVREGAWGEEEAGGEGEERPWEELEAGRVRDRERDSGCDGPPYV